MALKVTVSSGKLETPRSSAGLIKRPVDETGDRHLNVSVTEVVESVLAELRSVLDKEADVELELTAAVEIVTKDGVPTVSLDIGPDTGNTRTMRLKFTTKVNPEKKEG